MNDKQKILIVDDKKENLVALQWVLREVDAEIIEATNGNDALAATLNNRFAVAILDVQMPGMSGYELAENLRGEEKTRMIPIVFITAAYADEAHKFMGYEAGGVDYLTKPYSPEVLLGKIKIFLEIDRNRQELEMHRNHLETLVAERTVQLSERMKEVQCLYSVSSLVTERSKSISDTLTAAACLIPQGWQYPATTCARILFGGFEFASPNFRDTIWKLTADIVISGETVGMLEVCHLEERPTLDNGPFLKEEKDLIGDLARRLGNTIERKQTGGLERLARQVLEILNRTNNLSNIIRDILQLVEKSLDFEAVGIRLKEGEDFPYYVTSGFPEDFVRAEKYLCAYDDEGKIVRDSEGNSLLECMCGNIILGRTDATLPFFTNKGSFWTNSTTDLLATTTEQDRQAHTRNRCNGEGYESVALIPFRTDEKIIGLLQLNDRRRNRFTLKIINFLEDLGSSIGIALRRKQDKEALESLSQRNQLILRSAGEGILGLDLQGNHSFVNPSAAKMLGYEPEELLGCPSHSLWHHTRPDGSSYPREECEIYAAYREGLVHRTSTEVFWRKDGTSFPVEYVSTPIYEEGALAGAVVTFTDITERKEGEQKLLETLDGLNEAVATTIKIMVSTIEARDPYTAGHQLKVAGLAQAIATEMGLSPEKIEGIRMAGSIHDIGKISIPAEILSKPTKLSETELSLIKEHASRGFTMLKDVTSSWPLAEIVHQHHERMDGSGYPGNLKGEEILIEARILCVADVVEAMASHRPYRAGLGIDAALNEIEENSGIFYDETVADACLKLFREKGYKMAG